MIGKTVSHYRLLEKLGEGGMGIVYRAEDTTLHRMVALKFLPSKSTQDLQAKTRFINEARAASALDHPNICTIHEIDETDDDQLFIAMACYEGETLRQRIARGQLPLDEAMDITRQILQGLAKAHGQGIVHRDIKPANIFITNDGLVKVLDFGLAKLAGQARLTKTGSTLGTVAYMSPEQARGEEVDNRSDIWSLGVLIFEMLTGRLPFPGDHEQAVIYSILNEEPKVGEPSGIPSDLEAIIHKCLAKDTKERYRTTGDLTADLRRCVPEAFTSSARTQETVDLHRPRPRLFSRWPLIASLALVAVIAAVILSRLLPSSPEAPLSERRMLVVLPFENLGASEDHYFADGMTEEITSRLAGLSGLGVISRTSSIHYKDTRKTAKQIGEELKVDFILEGTVRWESAGGGGSRIRVTPRLIRVSDDTEVWSDRYDRAFDNVLTIQSEIAEQVVREMDVTLSGSERNRLQMRPTENPVAYQAYLRGLDYMVFSHAPEEDYRKALHLFEQAVELDSSFALGYVQLSEAHRCLYFYGYDRTEERLSRAWDAVQRALRFAPDLPAVHVALGYYYYQGLLDYDRALAEFAVAARDLPNDSNLLTDVAWIWRRQGVFERAIANMEEALALSPRDARLATELAYTYLMTRDFNRALHFCDLSLEIAPEQKWGYLVKALTLWARDGDLRGARAILEAMPDQRSSYPVLNWYQQEVYEGNFPAALRLLDTLPEKVVETQGFFAPKELLAGFAHSYLKDAERARASFDAARIFLEEEVKKRPDDPRVHSALGRAYAGLGRSEEAIREGELAVELYPVSKDALLGVERVWDLAKIYVTTGNYDRAVEQIAYLLSIPCKITVPLLRLEPAFEALQGYPRYRSLLEDHDARS